MVEAHNINWQHISASLPYGTDPASKQERDRLWKGMDVNGNGLLSLAEVDKGLRDILCLEEVFYCKRAIFQAFTQAKNSSNSKHPQGNHYVEKREFRVLLYNLRVCFEVYQAFARIDTGDDERIDLQEFLDGVDKLKQWVGDIADPEAEFQRIDTNGGGQVTFDEFVLWAQDRKLDLDDDDD